MSDKKSAKISSESESKTLYIKYGLLFLFFVILIAIKMIFFKDVDLQAVKWRLDSFRVKNDSYPFESFLKFLSNVFKTYLMLIVWFFLLIFVLIIVLISKSNIVKTEWTTNDYKPPS
jgi:hypothetical protein